MAVTNSGTSVLVDAAGVTLAGFTNAAAMGYSEPHRFGPATLHVVFERGSR